MIRYLQVTEHKPIKILPVSADMKRGAVVAIDYADSEIDKASAASGSGLVDVAPNFYGINSMINPNDGSFEDIKDGNYALFVTPYDGERYATTELTATGVIDGNYIAISGGKFVAAANTNYCGWRYCGINEDPSVSSVEYIVEKVPTAQVTTYAVTYNANTGTGTMADSIAYQSGNAAVVKTNAFTPPTGKVFKEFNTVAAGTGTSYNPGDSIAVSAAVALYAIWKNEA